MAALQDEIDRAITWLASSTEGLYSAVQSIGTPAFVFLLLLPVLVTLFTRRVALSVAALVLAPLSLAALIAPTSIASVLAMLSTLSLFLIAAAALLQRRRQCALEQKIADLVARMDQLENAESRRALIEMKRRDSMTGAESFAQKADTGGASKLQS